MSEYTCPHGIHYSSYCKQCDFERQQRHTAAAERDRELKQIVADIAAWSATGNRTITDTALIDIEVRARILMAST